MLPVEGANSVLQDEVNFFNNLSQDWWDEKGDMILLHTMNKIRVPMVRDGLFATGVAKKEFKNSRHPLEGVTILDAGCGGGLFSEPLAKLGADVTGIDPTEELLNVAKYHASLDKSIISLRYMLESVEAHSEKFEGKYDCVVSCEVLEHIDDHEIYLKACAKCLRPGGSLFAMTFSKNYLAKVVGIWIAEYVLLKVPKGSHNYEQFINHSDVKKMLEKYNCKTIDVSGMIVNPITNQWWWFPSTFLQYALHAVKEDVK